MSLFDINVLWNTLNFLVLMFLLHRFLYQPVVKVLEERRAKIKEDIDRARTEMEKAQALRQEYEHKLAQVDKKAQEIIDEAYRKAQAREEEIVNNARNEAQKELSRAKREIERAGNEARGQLRDEVATLSLLAAERYLSFKLDKKEDYKLMQRVIEELPKTGTGGKNER